MSRRESSWLFLEGMAIAFYARPPIFNSIATAASSPWRSTELILRCQHEGFIVLRFQPGFFDLAHVTHHDDHLTWREAVVWWWIHVKARSSDLDRALYRQHQHAESVLDGQLLDGLAHPWRFLSNVDLF